MIVPNLAHSSRPPVPFALSINDAHKRLARLPQSRAGRPYAKSRPYAKKGGPVVVLLTCNLHETAAVLRRFNPNGSHSIETRNGITYNLLGAHSGMQVVQRISKQGEGDAQTATFDAIRDWNPHAIIGVGIAFGVNQAKQKIGDVLVSEAIRGYDLGRINADGTISPRGPKPSASGVLYNRFNHLDQACQSKPNGCVNWPTVRFGTLLSGNKLVDNLDYRESLRQIEPDAIGGEMEAVGIQLAADRHKVDWIVVKAICDWGDGHKNVESKEQDQQLAADNAAIVVKAALGLGSLYQNSPSSLRMLPGWLVVAVFLLTLGITIWVASDIFPLSLVDEPPSLVVQLPKTPKPHISPQPPTATVQDLTPNRLWQDCSLCPEMVTIPAGQYLMGSPLNELGRSDDEDQRQVIFKDRFAIATHETTFSQYDAFAKKAGRTLPDDNGWGRGNRPVINVSWKDAVAYTEWLRLKTGKSYRLPTESEWEYAARSGVGSSQPWSKSSAACKFANVYDASTDLGPRWNWRHDCRDGYPTTAPVGSFAPNAFGLFDMIGNVWEWTKSCWQTSEERGQDINDRLSPEDCSERVIRGGSWRSGIVTPQEGDLRYAERQSVDPTFSHADLGFRVALSLGR